MSILISQTYRHELKYEIGYMNSKLLKHRLSLLMDPDEFANEDGSYFVRSLYFDTVDNKAYYEKIDGIEDREKYRIRYYNFDTSYIILEIKGKKGNLGYKKQDRINFEECQYLIDREYDKIKIDNRKVLESFIKDCKLKHLIPSIIVDYKRAAYTYPIADIRITFDSYISSGRFNYDFFDKEMMTHEVTENNQVILEVKYNDIMPKMISDLISGLPTTRISMSKFAICREKKGDI